MMVICDVKFDIKYDQILQNSSQEPSTSSKYWLHKCGSLDTLIIMIESWNLAHKSRIKYHGNMWCKEWPHPSSIQSGTCNILQVWLQGCGVIMLESWNLTQKSKITYDDPWCQILYLYIHFELCLSHFLSLSLSLSLSIFQVLGQEPSTSFKFGFWGQGF